MGENKTGLELLKEPFAAHQIGKLPKPTKSQTDEVKRDYKKGIRCAVCGGWHHPKVVHLDYVGHAALTDRLLKCDPEWNWEPFSVDDSGQPKLHDSGMWIRLTVCGVTRIGYGDAGGKKGGDAIKEIIGDALRNAAMRFGAALDLWHKGDLHIDDDDDLQPDNDTHPRSKPEIMPMPPSFTKDQQSAMDGWVVTGKDARKNNAFNGWWLENKPSIIKECSEAGAKLVYDRVKK